LNRKSCITWLKGQNPKDFKFFNLTEQVVQMDDEPFGSDDRRHGYKGSSVSRY